MALFVGEGLICFIKNRRIHLTHCSLVRLMLIICEEMGDFILLPIQILRYLEDSSPQLINFTIYLFDYNNKI